MKIVIGYMVVYFNREKNNEPTVRRLSLRLQQKDPEGVPLPPDALNSGRATFQYERVDEHVSKIIDIYFNEFVSLYINFYEFIS